MKIFPPSEEAISAAGEAIRNGKLVGLPTETVYGLAANALDPAAVLRVFEAKKRPADNPLIVHFASIQDIDLVAAQVLEYAQKLAETYWPGPLTLVLPKKPVVPDITTGGLDSVAVRVPVHPIAQAVIRAAGVPLAAPSANPFMAVSPTRANDLAPEILDAVELVIDGGPCKVGIESTVVDCTGNQPVVLRPGHISREQILHIAGSVGAQVSKERKSPGMYPKHYAPRALVRLVERLGNAEAGLTFDQALSSQQRQIPKDPVGFAQQLYAMLHELDEMNVSEIMIQEPPRTPEWEAVWDRLNRMIS